MQMLFDLAGFGQGTALAAPFHAFDFVASFLHQWW
jgi:hypothetical protein